MPKILDFTIKFWIDVFNNIWGHLFYQGIYSAAYTIQINLVPPIFLLTWRLVDYFFILL